LFVNWPIYLCQSSGDKPDNLVPELDLDDTLFCLGGPKQSLSLPFRDGQRPCHFPSSCEGWRRRTASISRRSASALAVVSRDSSALSPPMQLPAVTAPLSSNETASTTAVPAAISRSTASPILALQCFEMGEAGHCRHHRTLPSTSSMRMT